MVVVRDMFAEDLSAAGARLPCAAQVRWRVPRRSDSQPALSLRLNAPPVARRRIGCCGGRLRGRRTTPVRRELQQCDGVLWASWRNTRAGFVPGSIVAWQERSVPSAVTPLSQTITPFASATRIETLTRPFSHTILRPYLRTPHPSAQALGSSAPPISPSASATSGIAVTGRATRPSPSAWRTLARRWADRCALAHLLHGRVTRGAPPRSHRARCARAGVLRAEGHGGPGQNLWRGAAQVRGLRGRKQLRYVQTPLLVPA